MGKHIKGVLIGIIIVVSASLPSPLWELFPNLIPNPGFEEDLNMDGTPDFWRKEAQGKSFLSAEKTGPREGNAIFIDGEGSWMCNIENIQPERYYVVSARIKRENFFDGEYPEMHLFERTFRLNELFSWGAWIRLSWLIQSGKDIRTSLSFRSSGMRHRVWFDNISMRECTIQPTSPAEGQIFQEELPELKWLLPENDMILSIQLSLSQNKNFKESLVFKRFSPQGNSFQIKNDLRNGRWYWKLSVYKYGEHIATSGVYSFVIKNSKPGFSRVSKHKATPEDPLLKTPPLKDFFPIGMYNVPLSELAELKEAGFNSAQTYSSDLAHIESFISEAEKYKLKAMIHIPGDAWKKDITPFFLRAKNSPGILSWYLEDEPEGRGVPPSYIWKLNDYVHRMDSTHPTSLVLVRAKKAYDYGDGVDILMVDPYPIPHMPITWLSDSIEEARRNTSEKTPIWAVIQAFDWSAFPVGENKREWGRNPTYEEERCLTYLAIVHGAQGVFYFTYKSAKYNIREYPEHWEDVKRVVWELNRIYPLLLAPAVNHTLNIEVDPKGSETDKIASIHYSIRSVETTLPLTDPFIKKGMYIIAVNVTQRPGKVKFSSSLFKDEVSVVFESRVIPIEKGTFTDSFGPYGVHIYRM